MRCKEKRYTPAWAIGGAICGLCFSLILSSDLSFAVEPTSTETTSETTEDTPDGEKIAEPEYEPKSESELRRALTKIQYKVTQKAGTEEAFRNLYWNNKKDGLYRCVVCGLSLFSSETKYKSGTGWPSFYAPVKNENVGYQTDWVMFYPRKEVHCSRCKAHLGHVFDDGPKDKTGKRYCMNSAAMKFEPKKDQSSSKLKSSELKSE